MTTAWRQAMDPKDRAEADSVRYAEAVLHELKAEWMTVPVVRAAGGVGIARIRKILARSSADALLGLVLHRLVVDGLISVDDKIVRFEPALIERFES